jgi:hypothetical protein
MTKDRATEKKTTERWERMRGLSVNFPKPTESPSLAIDHESSEQAVSVGTPSYPVLRVWLHDRELPFKPIYSLGDVAVMVGKDVRTIRNWIVRWNAHCHYWPSGEPYFTPQDVEEILTWGCCVRREGK